MRYINRVMTLLGFIATVGSFVIAYLQFFDGDNGTRFPPRMISPDSRAAPEDEQVPDPAVSPEAACDLGVYEAIARRLRNRSRSGDTVKTGRFKWLGADRSYDYYYDYRAERVVCTPYMEPADSIVKPGTAQRRKAKNWKMIWPFVGVIILSSLVLVYIHLYRLRRDAR